MELLRLYTHTHTHTHTHTRYSWYVLVSKKSAVQRRIPSTSSLDLKYPAVR